MPFEIKPATRTGIPPLVGFFGKSGSGKTLSALFFARGLVGPAGRITMVDSESRRGSLFADIVPGGYNVIDLEPPFSPERYEEAIVTAEAQSDIVLVDSLSHEWSGEGGVLDLAEAELDRMAGNDYAKRERVKLASWIKPKMAHKQFVQRLLRLKCGLVVCLRGEEKTRMEKGKDGKNVVVHDEWSSPLYDPRFLFELLLCLETVAHDGQGGFVIPRKVTHPTIAKMLPARDQQISEAHGKALAEWCGNPNRITGPPPSLGMPPDPPDVKAFKRQLWDLTKPRHHGDVRLLDRWLIDEMVLSDTESLGTLALSRWPEVIAAAKAKLQPQTAS